MRRCANQSIVVFVMCVLAMPTVAADLIERRGTEPALRGTIRSIGENGVTIRSATGADLTVTWDHIRNVTTDDPNLASQVNAYHDLAMSLWRARTRLERGDFALAEPLFERLFAEYRGRSHETALIVAEGLLRCRLQRSANDTAVIPALEIARLKRKGVSSSAYNTLPPLIDEATSLCTRLPPAWVPSGALARMELELKSYDAQGDTVIAAIAGLYREAARQQLNLATVNTRDLALDHPGVVMLRSLVNCNNGDADERAAARTALEKRLSDMTPWSQAWARYAIGISLLGESGIGRQEAGLVSLTYVPASSLRDQPYLAAISLATMVLALQRMGEVESAAALRSDLVRDFPNHPALAMLDKASALNVRSVNPILPNDSAASALVAKEPA